MLRATKTYASTWNFKHEFQRDLSYFSRFADVVTMKSDFAIRATDLGKSLFGMCPPVSEGDVAFVAIEESDAGTLGRGFMRGLEGQAVNSTLCLWKHGDLVEMPPDSPNSADRIYFVVPSLTDFNADAYLHVVSGKTSKNRVIVAALTISDVEIDQILVDLRARATVMETLSPECQRPLFVGLDWDTAQGTGPGSDIEIDRQRLAKQFAHQNGSISENSLMARDCPFTI